MQRNKIVTISSNSIGSLEFNLTDEDILLFIELLKRFSKKTQIKTPNYQKSINYKSVSESAWSFLIANQIKELPLDLFKIAEQNNWHLINYDECKELATLLDTHGFSERCDAWTITFDGNIYIIYRKGNHDEHLRFILAHEFGHIVLNHIEELSANEYESEANMFAARILMPACILKECGAITAKEISKLCGTSLTAANFRAERMQKLLIKDCFYTNPLEKQVYKQFRRFIIKSLYNK